MRDYKVELSNRIDFIKEILNNSGATGIVYGNSGGKDSALVGILCKMACDNTTGVLMPCSSKRNFTIDLEDGTLVAEQFSIKTITVDLTPLRTLFTETLENCVNINSKSLANIAPRLRMMTLYSIAGSENLLVAGTGNRSEGYMGYFTKWGDGAHDFNPIADLTVTEIYEFLRYLGAPQSIIDKAPSAGLFEGQTDESEMGITYASIDEYLLNGNVSDSDKEIIDRYHNISEHKRQLPYVYGG